MTDAPSFARRRRGGPTRPRQPAGGDDALPAPHLRRRGARRIDARAAAALARTSMAACLLAAACGIAGAQVTLRDDRGTVLSWPAVPQRLVTLLPSLTESVCALGACDRLVGTDRFSNWPASAAGLPKLGGLDDTQIERIVALRPDAVLVAASARVVDRLEALGLKVVVIDSRTHADVRRSLATVAQLLGTPAEADRVWDGIERETRAASERVPAELRGQRVYFEIGGGPYAAGAASFIGETIARLGLVNALPAELGSFPKLNPEYVVRLQPDIVMGVQASVDEMRKRPGWHALRALANGRSCAFSDARYELLIRPGPRMGEAAAVIADCLVGLPRAPSAAPLARPSALPSPSLAPWSGPPLTASTVRTR